MKLNLLGRRFDRLTVIDTVPPKNQKSRWLCKCVCGEVKTIRANDLLTGNTKSCGCLHKEKAAERGKKMLTTHGQGSSRGSRTPEFTTWSSAKNRCNNPNNKDYPRYGGRGIRVCEKWTNSFEAFFADMGKRPGPKHSLDRINVDGDYEPSNCRWATWTQQANNRRKAEPPQKPHPICRFLTYQGKTQYVRQWARELGIDHHTLYGRLRKGWSIERAFTQPVKKQARRI